MDKILTFQGTNTGERNTWVLDDALTGYDGSTYHREILGKLSKTDKMWDCAKVLSHFVSGTSQSLHIYMNKDGELILISNFEDLDEIGRRIAYQFYHAPANQETICNDFRKYCSIAKKTPIEADIKCLQYALHLYNYRYYYAPTLIGIPVLVMIMLLLKLCK